MIFKEIQKIVGPEDPKLAKNTNPNSLNALYATSK